MKEIDKELLIKDLSARVFYGVKVNIKRDFPNNPQIVERIGCDGEIIVQNIFAYDIYYYKPYLRPMSSMMEKEKEYIKNRWCYEDWNDIYNFLNHYQIDAGDAFSFVDWLNAHHFDYRGLIEKGLALEAPDDMYNV